MANTNPAHVVLTNVRLSYTHLTEPGAARGATKSVMALRFSFPKPPRTTKTKIRRGGFVPQRKPRGEYGAAFPAQPKHSVHDGDGVRPSDGQPFGPECRGCWVFTASSDIRPKVVDGNLQDILDPTAIYSGMYANVGISFFGYNNPQNKGIGVSLDNVQKIRGRGTAGLYPRVGRRRFPAAQRGTSAGIFRLSSGRPISAGEFYV